MSDYKTPGVYIEEINSLPPSVVQVATAIPAFIGYTEFGTANKATRITNMLDYQSLFGGPPMATYTVNLDTNSNIKSITAETSNYILYYSLQLFFANGGGPCYIVSIGGYDSAGTKEASAFSTGLDLIEREDEPTLLVLTDALSLPSTDYEALCNSALLQCATLKDRFSIFDLAEGDSDGSVFRNFGLNNLGYGAVYTPHLQTSIVYQYDETNVTVITDGGDTNGVLMNTLKSKVVYGNIKTALNQQYVQLPSSAAMAGIYAQVDASRGVWKAPANVAVASVIAPARLITSAEQEGLNVDPTGGKSINAIRSFTGKGTLVWGARTLLGNDNEWRYINVRRLFITIEESVQKSTSFAVFEPNDATTWLKVKAMIENYLYGLWQQGALAGSTPEASYFVKVGLGKTMTSDDVLNGRMIVEVGVAPARPAEFIILKFSQVLQQA